MSLKKALRLFVSRFVNDKRGIVTLWGIIFIAMAVYFICWLTIGMPLIVYIDAIRNLTTVTWSAQAEAVIDGCLFAFEIHPVIAMFAWFLYGIIHSTKREQDVYEYARYR